MTSQACQTITNWRTLKPWIIHILLFNECSSIQILQYDGHNLWLSNIPPKPLHLLIAYSHAISDTPFHKENELRIATLATNLGHRKLAPYSSQLVHSQSFNLFLITRMVKDFQSVISFHTESEEMATKANTHITLVVHTEGLRWYLHLSSGWNQG